MLNHKPPFLVPGSTFIPRKSWRTTGHCAWNETCWVTTHKPPFLVPGSTLMQRKSWRTKGSLHLKQNILILPIWWNPLKVANASSFLCWHMNALAYSVHNSTLRIFFYHMQELGKRRGAINKFGTCSQWRSELFKVGMWFLSNGRNELYAQWACGKRIVAPLRSKTNMFSLFYFWQKVDQGPKCTLAILHCKTRLAIFRRDVTNQTFPGREISLNFFYSV